MALRRAVVGAGGLFLAALVFRQAMVSAYSGSNPERAVAWWPAHPDALLAANIERIGALDRAGRPVDQRMTDPIVAATRIAPLSPEPFLVYGNERRLAGDEVAAGAAFRAAVTRDPRSVAARLFLAGHYARTGHPALALGEFGRMIRLYPRSGGKLAPQIALALQAPGTIVEVRALVADNPELREDILEALATDSKNIGLIMTLAPPGTRGPWVRPLIDSLVRAGAYDRAYAFWAGQTGTRALLTDPRFSTAAPPPFGWSLASGGAGTAEPDGRGGLHIVYYGREPLTAASQLLVLPPGRYRFSFALVARTPRVEALHWALSCVPTGVPIAEAGLAGAAPGVSVVTEFSVIDGCAAQQLDLLAVPVTETGTSDITLDQLAIVRLP